MTSTGLAVPPRHPDAVAGGPAWPFVVGLLLVVGGLIVITTSLGAAFYEVSLKSGAQPPGGSDPSQPTITLTIDLFGITIKTPGESEDEPFSERPVIGAHMVPLRALLIIGAALATAGALAGVLHRFRVLRPVAVGPTFALAGVVVVASGLIAFTVSIADAAYLELFSNGRLQPQPAFFTINADGDQVHDVHTLPRAGFWLATSGAVALLVGGLLMFHREMLAAWHHLSDSPYEEHPGALGTQGTRPVSDPADLHRTAEAPPSPGTAYARDPRER